MTETATSMVSPKRRRWLWIALIGSLAINAMLVGVIVRGLWHVRASVAMTGGGIEASLPAFVSTLPADRRDVLRRAGAPERPGALRPLRLELRRARAEAARIFLAEPFDKQAFIAAQAKLSEAEANLRASIQRLLPEIGASMTVAERRAYLNWRAPGFGGGPGGGFRRGSGNGQRGGQERGGPEREGEGPSGPGPRRP